MDNWCSLAITFIHIVVVNARSPITGIICLICLIFLFFETAFGICLGCKFYSMFYKEKAQYCQENLCCKYKAGDSKHPGFRCLLFWDLLHTSSLQYFYSMIILVKNHMTCLEPKVLHYINKYCYLKSESYMKALVYTEYRCFEVLQLKEVEKPTPKNYDVFVRIRRTRAGV